MGVLWVFLGPSSETVAWNLGTKSLYKRWRPGCTWIDPVVFKYCSQTNSTMVQMKVAKCPSDRLSLTNCLIVNENDFSPERVK